VPVTLGHVTIDDGGARLVDQHVAPPFAVDLTRLAGQFEGLSTDPRRNRLGQLNGRAGATSIPTMRARAARSVVRCPST
jgi:hypothetical protein